MDIKEMEVTLVYVANTGQCRGFLPGQLKEIAKHLVELDETVKRQAEQLAAHEMTIHAKRTDRQGTAIIESHLTLAGPMAFSWTNEIDHMYLDSSRDYKNHLCRSMAGRLTAEFERETAEKLWDYFSKNDLLSLPDLPKREKS